MLSDGGEGWDKNFVNRVDRLKEQYLQKTVKNKLDKFDKNTGKLKAEFISPAPIKSNFEMLS